MNKERLQQLNFERLKKIINHQRDVNDLVEEGDVWCSEGLLPIILVFLSIIDFYQHRQLVEALDTSRKL